MSKHSKSNINISLSSNKSNLSNGSDKNEKLKTGTEQSTESLTQSVRLGEYVRKREWSKEKLIIGQVKSSQLLGNENASQKELYFKKEKINRFYDKIVA